MTNGLPLQSNCDPNDPDEFAAWAFTGMLGPGNAPAIFPPAITAKMSRRLWDLGYRHHPELQTVEYVVTGHPQDFISANVGKDVPITDGKKDANTEAARPAAPDTSNLTAAEKRALYEELREQMFPTPDAPTDRARVEGEDEGGEQQ